MALRDELTRDALAPLQTMLSADGYTFVSTIDDRRLVITIIATSAACADCLVPAEAIALIVKDRLADAGVEANDLAIDVVMP